MKASNYVSDSDVAPISEGTKKDKYKKIFLRRMAAKNTFRRL